MGNTSSRIVTYYFIIISLHFSLCICLRAISNGGQGLGNLHFNNTSHRSREESSYHDRYRLKRETESNAVEIFTYSGGPIVFDKLNYENLDGTPPSDWLREIVRFHNILRKRHGSGSLILDYELAYQAQLYAMQIANKSMAAGKIILNDGVHNIKLGENTGARKGRSRHQLFQLPGSFPVRVWYSEIARHSWTTNYYQANSGHFTQVVWNATKRVGCGRVVTEKLCREGKLKLEPIYIVVCRYSPPGNWLHKQAYKDHVHPPKVGKPNQIPDFTKFCPQDSKPCSKPIVCCTDANTMKDHTENINCSSLSSRTSQSSALNNQFGRSFVFSGTKTTSTLRPDYISKNYLGRSVMSASYHRGLPWPLWHDKRGRNIRQ